MVQEFQVLRCFSCRTFQVQQVKKSKKWSCKMCGEKQSLIKEYGRGSGADCRRHVQKLNSLRGELLEVENEQIWTQWEKEKEREAEDCFGDEVKSCEPQQEMQGTESRWSKYVNQTDSEPKDDEAEEGSIFTERARFRSCDEMRKRKKSFYSRGAGAHYTVCEDEEAVADSAHWIVKRGHFQQHLRGGSPAAGCSSKTPDSLIHDSSTASQSSKPDGVYSAVDAVGERCSDANRQQLTSNHLRSTPATSSYSSSSASRRSSETKADTVRSRWAQFLTPVSVEEEKEDDAGAQWSPGGPDAEVAHSPLMAFSTATRKKTERLKRDDGLCGRASLDEVQQECDEGNRSMVRAFEKVSQCMTGMASSSPANFTSKPDTSRTPVCCQPPPVIRPCPALSLSAFFQTNEDFEDSF